MSADVVLVATFAALFAVVAWWDRTARRHVEEERVLRPDGGRAGYWRVTELGAQFVEGKVTVPQYAEIYQTECLGLTGDQVSIQDALGDPFVYSELMGERATVA